MQIGILTFLRRSPKAQAPMAPRFTNPAESASAPTAGPAPRLEEAAATPIVSAPQAFRSERYGYTLTLPAGWRAMEPRSIAGSPPIDRFTDDHGTNLSIWNEPCPFRTLPDVPSTERAGTLALADGALVPFVAFAPTQKDGAQLLEGRWPAGGKRWTIDVQEPFTGQGAALSQVLRRLVATLVIEG